MKVKSVTFFFILTLLLGKAFAGGFQLNEHSAKAMAMGGAFTAIANDPSALYFNGAGILQFDGTHFMLGTTMIAPTFSFRGVTPAVTQYDAKKLSFFPTHFYATYRINNDFAVGLAFDSPFGLGSEWPDNWVGKYLAIKTSLQVFDLSPVVAYKITDNLFVSAAFVYSFANVDITQNSPQTPFAGDAFTSLSGKDNAAYGYNLGLLYKPVEGLSLGVSFHSQISYKFKGTVTTTGAKQLASLLPNGEATAPLKTPYNLVFGAAYDIIPQLKISADLQLVGWSSYDTLKVDFSNPQYTDISSPRNYKNSYIIRFGADYKLMPELSVLGGIYYDKSPVDPQYVNPSLPDANRLGFSIGVNYKLTNNLQVSAGYLFIRSQQTTVTNSQEPYELGNAGYGVPGASGFNGTYNAYANLISLTLSYGL